MTLALVERMMVGPLAEVCRAIFVAQIAILSVRHQPRFCLLKECLKLGRSHHSLAFLLIYYAQIFVLGVVHALIVNLRQGVEFLAQGLKPFAFGLVGNRRQGVEVGILRMQREDAYAAVGIRVGPCVGGG